MKRQDTLLGAFCSITRVRTLQETSFQSRLAERDKRAELSATCRRKTSSDHVANDDIGRRPVSLKASFNTAESSERCLSTPCSRNQTHRPFHVARQLLETTVIHALATLETPPQPLATLETPPYHGVCTRWLVGVRAWTLPAAWVKTPRSRGENDAGRSFVFVNRGLKRVNNASTSPWIALTALLSQPPRPFQSVSDSCIVELSVCKEPLSLSLLCAPPSLESFSGFSGWAGRSE